MTHTGGCYCGELTYEVTETPLMKGQCHCRECQYIAGGGPQYFTALPTDGFRYTSGAPKSFQRDDLRDPVTREFCAKCGTHIVTRRSDFDGVILKIGTLDDVSLFDAPRVAIYTKDILPFHHIPEGCAEFSGAPPRG